MDSMQTAIRQDHLAFFATRLDSQHADKLLAHIAAGRSRIQEEIGSLCSYLPHTPHFQGAV